MGSGIAESVAVAGMPVVVRDIDDAAVSAARGRIEVSLARAAQRGKIADPAEVLERIDVQTMSAAMSFAERIGKRAIVTKDRSGFIVNMLLVPYLMAAVRMYEDGFATREDIDAGMKLGCGHPMGPLELSDFIGLDVLYAVCDSLYEEFKRPEYAPPPLMKRMVASGRLGRKSGRGFYDYVQ